MRPAAPLPTAAHKGGTAVIWKGIVRLSAAYPISESLTQFSIISGERLPERKFRKQLIVFYRNRVMIDCFTTRAPITTDMEIRTFRAIGEFTGKVVFTILVD